MRRFVLAVVLGGAAPLAAQTPGTDIWLADLSVRDGRVAVGKPANVTARAGYDNQPAFLPDGSGFLYTRIGADGQADIWRYQIAQRRTSAVITTPESEYSATPQRGGRAFTVVRVERDSTQRLWRFAPPDSPTVVLKDLKPVGYQAWTDAGTVVTFVLGDPNALVVADVGTGRADTAARNIGRALQPVPGRPAVSFVERVDSTEAWLAEVNVINRETKRLVRLPPRAEFHVWTPLGIALTTDGAMVFQWDPVGGQPWTPVIDLAAEGLRGATRLAVSAKGDRLAIVARDPPP